MIGFLGIVFLVGASLASEPSSLRMSEMEKVLNTVSENKAYVEACQGKLGFHLGINFTSCEAAFVDFASAKGLILSLGVDLEALAVTGESLYAQYLKCQTESIFKQLSCYNSLISKAKAAVAEAEEEYAELSPEVEALITQLEIDIEGCIGNSSLNTIETKLRLCKRKLVTKN